MSDIVVKTCVVCNTEKSIDDFSNKYRECKVLNIEWVLKRSKNDKDKILQERRDKSARFKKLDNRLKALEEKLSVKNNST